MQILSDGEEEILESLWIAIEEKHTRPDTSLLRDAPAFGKLCDKHLVDVSSQRLLTDEGLEEARQCVRRHRLAERLVADIFEARDQLIHQASCKFEHGLHHGLEDKVCALLGHPKTCPHGKAIPPGDCCRSFEKNPQRLIMPLGELAPGDSAKISYINTHDADLVRRLVSMGVLPGNRVVLLHRFPSFVFEMNNSSFAIDSELARHIYVVVLKRGQAVNDKKQQKGKRWRFGRR